MKIVIIYSTSCHCKPLWFSFFVCWISLRLLKSSNLVDDSPPWITKFKQVAHSFSIIIWNPTGKCLSRDISRLKECSKSVDLKAKVSGGPNVNTEHTYNHLLLDTEALLSSPFNDMDICQSTHSPHSLPLIDDIWAEPAEAIILRSDPTNHEAKCCRGSLRCSSADH